MGDLLYLFSGKGLSESETMSEIGLITRQKWMKYKSRLQTQLNFVATIIGSSRHRIKSTLINPKTDFKIEVATTYGRKKEKKGWPRKKKETSADWIA